MYLLQARELYLTYGYMDMKCSYGWFKRWSQRFQIQLRYSYDDEIIEWILSRYDENLAVSAQDLQNYGLSLIKKEDPSFKASSGWALRQVHHPDLCDIQWMRLLCRFSKRHKEFLTSDGTFESKMPPHLENRIGTFRSMLAQLQREKQFPAFQVSRRTGGPLQGHLKIFPCARLARWTSCACTGARWRSGAAAACCGTPAWTRPPAASCSPPPQTATSSRPSSSSRCAATGARVWLFGSFEPFSWHLFESHDANC